MDKPLIIELNETKAEITSVVNNAIQRGLPCYLIEPMLSELLYQIKDGARNELRIAAEQMQNEENQEQTDKE